VQDDQDLVHCFVDKGGLDTLVSVGEDADHNYIIYIIRGLSARFFDATGSGFLFSSIFVIRES
jgi:hypothetical protein